MEVRISNADVGSWRILKLPPRPFIVFSQLCPKSHLQKKESMDSYIGYDQSTIRLFFKLE